jgi:DNA polymerase-3 subunit gamma/tau
VIEIDAASNRGIDNIRDLREDFAFLPLICRKKVYIIDEVHQLSRDAVSALLKTFEEPPEHIRFILATTEADKILDTILSRCQQYRFHPLALEQIVQSLKRCLDKETWSKVEPALCEEILYMIASASEGGMRDAQSILDQVTTLVDESMTLSEVEILLGGVHLDTLLRITEAIRNKNTLDALALVHEIYSNGQDMGLLVRDLLAHFRNLMVARVAPDNPSLYDLPPDRIQTVVQQAQSLAFEDILHGIDILFEAERRLRFTQSPRSVAEAALVRMVKIPTTLEIEALLGREDIALAALPTRTQPVTVTPPLTKPPSSPLLVEKKTDPPRATPATLNENHPGVIPELPADPPPPVTPSVTTTEPSLVTDESVTLEEIKDQWEIIHQKVARRDARYGGYLSVAVPYHLAGRILEFAIPAHLDFHRQQLGTRNARELLKEILHEHLRTPLEDVIFKSLPETDPIFSRLLVETNQEPFVPQQKITPEIVLEAEPPVRLLLEAFEGQVLEIRNNPNE